MLCGCELVPYNLRLPYILEIWPLLGALRVLEASWRHLGRLGGILERLGSVLERLGGILERLGAVLEPSWSLLEPLGGVLKRLGASWSPLARDLARC